MSPLTGDHSLKDGTCTKKRNFLMAFQTTLKFGNKLLTKYTRHPRQSLKLPSRV